MKETDEGWKQFIEENTRKISRTEKMETNPVLGKNIL